MEVHYTRGNANSFTMVSDQVMTSKEKPKLLFVTDKYPWPVDDGGQIRTHQLLKHLGTQYSVKLLAIAPLFVNDTRARLSLEVDTITFNRPHRRWKMFAGLVLSLITNRPYPLTKNFSRQMLEAIQNEIDTGTLDAIHFNHLDAAQYVHWLNRKRRRPRFVFDTHNVLSSLYARLLTVERNPIRWMYAWTQWQKMRSYEDSTMQKVDCVIVCSERERREVNEWGIENCIVVPNGVDTQEFTPLRTTGMSSEGVQLLFIGALDYRPNADGIRWFIRSVLPELACRLENFKLTVVGKNPPKDLLAHRATGRVEFTGNVDDVRPYARSADVFVVPLHIGGGTRLKILEALAMELPVVSTAVGAEGLELRDGLHLRIAEDSMAMAVIIAELCRCPTYAREMARRGREQVLENYDWAAVTVPLCEYYKNSVSKMNGYFAAMS